MTGKDLLIGLGEISLRYYDEAENDTIASGQSHKVRPRPLLIAAVIALTLLLAGCAIVYALSLKEIKLGDRTVTYDVYDDDPNSINPMACIGQEIQTQQVLTLAGLSGSPASQAAREWYDFCESFDPDRAIQKAVWGKEPEFPEEYKGYGLYTQEQKDKLDEILFKYHLKLRGKPLEFKTSKQLFRALGMENVLNPDSEATMKPGHASYYENGNLNVDFSLVIPGENGTASEATSGRLYYRPKDCFIPDTAVLTEAQWEEWTYTTTSGDRVLILRSEGAGSAWIFCDMPDCTASVQLDAIRNLYEEKENGVPVAKFTIMTKHQLEQVADAIDFSLEPKLVEGWETLPDNAVPAGQEINGYQIEPVSAFTDGYCYEIVLRVTAPEGVALTDPEDNTAGICAGSEVYGYCREDGDGKRNTCNYILTDHTSKFDFPEDGSLPYPEGYVIPVYWEDLYYSYFDFTSFRTVDTLLTEGTWDFRIPLNDADLREVELLTQPITAQAAVGFLLDGTDVLETRQITSVKLRARGLSLTCEDKNADFFCQNRQRGCLVMQDGSQLELTNESFDQTIDLDQVAYVQLADKTILPMPGVDEDTVRILSEIIQAQKDAAYVPAPTFEDGVELLTEPITLKHLGGYATDASGDMDPLYEYIKITSIILHPKGLALMGPAAFDFPDTQATVVMKDGSQILLTGMGGGPYCDEPMSQLAAESTIDITKVDHLILPDGTELSVPPM